MQKKHLLAAAALPAVLLVAGAAMAQGRGGPPPQAVANAAQAGVNLLNTVASNAGVGNGPEYLAPPSVTTSTETWTATTTKTETVEGETTTTVTPGATTTTVTPTSQWTLNNDEKNGNNQGNDQSVYKRSVSITTETTGAVTTETTPLTEVESQRTDTYAQTTTTTTYADVDPGKSQARNQAPETTTLATEETAPATVTEGEWQVVSETALAPLVVETVDETGSTTTTAGTETCKVGSGGNPCNF